MDPELSALIHNIDTLMKPAEDMLRTADDPPNRRWVVCSANRWRGLLAIGPRQFHPIMREQMGAYLSQWAQEGEQGFIDQDGVFMTREEAWAVAEAAGQIRHPGFPAPQGILLSYHLYP